MGRSSRTIGAPQNYLWKTNFPTGAKIEMVHRPYLLELGKALTIAGLWLAICLFFLNATLSPLVIGFCLLVGIALRGEALIRLIHDSRPRIRFTNDVFYSTSFRLYGQVMQGNVESAQDYQATNALVLVAPLSLVLDARRNAMFMVLYSHSKSELAERKEAAFLQFSQIFPDSKVLSGRELEDFCNQFTDQSNDESGSLTRTPLPISLASFEERLPTIDDLGDADFDWMIVVPYIESGQETNQNAGGPQSGDETPSLPEGWTTRQPYLLIDPNILPHSEFDRNRQLALSHQDTEELRERLALFLPLRGTNSEDATSCTAVLGRILERRSPSLQPAISSSERSQSPAESQVATELLVETSPVVPSQVEVPNTIHGDGDNAVNSEEGISEIPLPVSENIDNRTQDSVFCTELCHLQQLSLPKDVLQDLCRNFHKRSLQMLDDSTIRAPLERAKLAGIDELIVTARSLCNDFPAAQVLCLLGTFANCKESAFDLRELNDLLNVLRLTLPLWINADSKVTGSFPEKSPSCSYCHLRELSSESCMKISSHLDHLVSSLVYRFTENSQTLSRVERIDLGKKIVEELKSQDIKIVLPCLIRAVVSQLKLPSSSNDLELGFTDDTSATPPPQLVLPGRG